MRNLSVTLLGCFILFFFNGYSQDIDGLNSKHERWEYILEDTGDILQIGLPVSAGIMTLIKKDCQGTKKLALSYGTTLAVTYSLKYLTKKERPEERNHFDSFPSGHTSSAFSGASFIQRRYGWKYGTPAYILATLVAVSRTEAPDGYHDGWDILAGAAIGISSTYLFTKPYLKEHVDIGFSTRKNSYVLSFTYKF
ncbi:MAG: phosphatase PAP2 family protein [Maribacter sp.]